MSGQKQHVDLSRKLGLRRRLLETLGPVGGAAYVPFIGDGDIAAELYDGREVYGADLDPKRVEVAASRVRGRVVVADCDRWPFAGLDVPFAVADFDAYAYPYDAFRAWWENAAKADRCALVFTDGERMAINAPPYKPHMPDGRKVDTAGDPKARRVLYNAYWAKQVRPWFVGAVDGWHIVTETKYLRGTMLYWGAVIERGEAPPTAAQATPTAARASVRELQFAAQVNGGASWPAAARGTRPPYSEEPCRVARRCIEKGLIADPAVVATEMRAGVAEGLVEIRSGARSWLVGFLNEHREQLGAALVEAAESGNIPAIKEAFDRLMGPEVQRAEINERIEHVVDLDLSRAD